MTGTEAVGAAKKGNDPFNVLKKYQIKFLSDGSFDVSIDEVYNISNKLKNNPSGTVYSSPDSRETFFPQMVLHDSDFGRLPPNTGIRAVGHIYIQPIKPEDNNKNLAGK